MGKVKHLYDLSSSSFFSFFFLSFFFFFFFEFTFQIFANGSLYTLLFLHFMVLALKTIVLREKECIGGRKVCNICLFFFFNCSQNMLVSKSL